MEKMLRFLTCATDIASEQFGLINEHTHFSSCFPSERNVACGGGVVTGNAVLQRGPVESKFMKIPTASGSEFPSSVPVEDHKDKVSITNTVEGDWVY